MRQPSRALSHRRQLSVSSSAARSYAGGATRNFFPPGGTKSLPCSLPLLLHPPTWQSFISTRSVKRILSRVPRGVGCPAMDLVRAPCPVATMHAMPKTFGPIVCGATVYDSKHTAYLMGSSRLHSAFAAQPCVVCSSVCSQFAAFLIRSCCPRACQRDGDW